MQEKHATEYKLLARRIRHFRKLRGLTQAQLSEKANISMSYLSKIEATNCQKAFSLEVLFALCEALEITTEEFFQVS